MPFFFISSTSAAIIRAGILGHGDQGPIHTRDDDIAHDDDRHLQLGRDRGDREPKADPGGAAENVDLVLLDELAGRALRGGRVEAVIDLDGRAADRADLRGPTAMPFE